MKVIHFYANERAGNEDEKSIVNDLPVRHGYHFIVTCIIRWTREKDSPGSSRRISWRNGSGRFTWRKRSQKTSRNTPGNGSSSKSKKPINSLKPLSSF
jgi:hypothetical protein